MEFRTARVTSVMNSVVRLHNFCRDRLVEVPTYNVGKVTQPTGVSFDSSGRIDSDFFDIAATQTGRRLSNQAAASQPREDIRSELEILGIGRPAHNIARNKHR